MSEDSFRGSERDPLSLNLYTYCVNNPVNLWDPSGHRAEGDVFYNGSKYNDANDVMSMQGELNSQGYIGADGKPLAVDGAFGPNTEYAVRQFQADHGLSVDGMAGNNTWGTLFASSGLPARGEPNSTARRYGPNGEVVQERKYGPDGKAQSDTDYNHGGVGHEFPHEHEWQDGVRGAGVPMPQPGTGTSNKSDSAVIDGVGTVAGGVAIGTIIYWVVSETSRVLFPPRNLIPIP